MSGTASPTAWSFEDLYGASTAPAAPGSEARPAEPTAWSFDELFAPKQSLPAAVGSAAMQGLIGGAGQAIAGPARMHLTAEENWADAMLHAVGMLAFDEGAAYRALTPTQRALLSNYRRATPERQAAMQAEWQAALAQPIPDAVYAGEDISAYGQKTFPVAPEQEGVMTNAARMAGALPPALAAAGVGALVGGAPGGIAGMTAAMFGQAYEATYQSALAKGADEEQAAEAATKNAAIQSVVNVVPLTRVLNNIPAPLRDKFVQTIAKIGQSGLEFAGANALGRFAENFVMRETVDPTTDLGEGVWDDAKAGALLGTLIPGAAVAGRQVGRTARNHLGPATSAEVRVDLARAAALAAKARTEALAAEAQPTIAPEVVPMEDVIQPAPPGEPSTPAQGTIPLPFNPDIPTMRITPEPEAPDGPTPAWQVENTAAIRDLLTKAPAIGERIRALHDEGKTAGEIAAELGSGWSANDIRAARDVLGLVAHGPAVGMLGKVPEQELSPNALPEGPVQDVLPSELGRPAEDVAPAPEAVAPGPVGPGLLPPMADLPRPPKPPSLVDFLISKGGVRPDGDLLALGLDTVHHQRAGRLLNKKGAKADMAREAAVEAGYLPPDATLTDFYDALAEEHAGRPVYPPEYASEANEWAQGRAADRERIRGEELAVEARAMAEQAGIKLTPDEEMHAARLLIEGVRPEEAVYEAVRATDAERVQAYNEARGMLSAREKGQADQRAQGAPSPEAGRARQELAVVMQRLMRHFGLPSSVGLKLVDRLVDAEGNAADASYIRSLITYALDTPAPDAPVKLFHEVTHALMDPQLGVLTETQRNALLRAADRWLAQAGNREALADLRYTQEQMREEAVARVAEEVLTRARREAPITTRAVEAMNRAVEAIGAGLRGQGFWSADGVFRAVMQGRVKGDGKGRADGESLSRRPPKPPPSGPDLFGGERREPEQRAAVPTYRTDPRQQAMPGMEPSAVQAQAARDQTGRGGLEPRVPQARPDEGLFGRPQAETSPLITPRPETSRLIGNLKNFVDMIRDVPDTGRPHVDARTFTLDKGKNGIEYIAIIAGDRNQVVHAGTTNQPNFVAIDTSQLEFAPDGTLTVHHNHPNKSSLSVADITMSAVPSLANIVAHAGDDMHSGRVGERLLDSIKRQHGASPSLSGAQMVGFAKQSLSRPYERAKALVYPTLKRLLDSRVISVDEANFAFDDMVNRLLHQAKWIDLTTTRRVAPNLEATWKSIQRDAQRDDYLAGNRPANTVRLDEGLAGLSRAMGRDAAGSGGPPIAGGPENAARGTGPAGRQDRLLEGDDQFSRRAPENDYPLLRRMLAERDQQREAPAQPVNPPLQGRPAASAFVRSLPDFVDMIADVPNTGRPQMDSRTFTLNQKNKDIEYISVVSADSGEVVQAGTMNKGSAVEFAPSEMADVPAGSLTFHHNHPDGLSISRGDMIASVIPAIGHVVAHTDDAMYIVRPGPRLLGAMRKWSSALYAGLLNDAERAIAAPYRAAERISEVRVFNAFQRREVGRVEAWKAYSDIRNRLLHQAGWIDYVTTFEIPRALHWALESALKEGRKNEHLLGDRPTAAVSFDEAIAGLSPRLGGDEAGAGPPLSARGTDESATRVEQEESGQFSRRPTRQNNLGLTRPAWKIDDPTVLDSAIRLFQDNKVDLKRVQQRITDLYGPIAESRDAYGKDERYHGRVASRVQRLHEQRIKPILQQIAKNREGVTVDDVDRYLLARHAPERNAAMKEINPDRVDNEALSGMSDADAAAAMVAFERDGKLKRLEAIAKDVDKLTADTRRVMRAEGLETADTIKLWEDAYQFYAPLQRDVEGQSAPRGSGFNVRGPESKRAMGSTREVKNILANIVAQAETAAIRAEKNKVTTALADLAKQYPADGFWKVDEVPTTRQINKDTGLVETIPDPLYQLADNIVMYKEGGKHHFIAFDKKNPRAVEVARAMKNLGVEGTGEITRIAAIPARFMASLLTRWNPEFWVTNFIRDASGAQYNWFGTGLKKGRRDVIANIPKAMKGLRDLYRGEGTSEWARYAKEMDAAGGTTGHMDMYETSDKRMDNLKSEVAKMQQGTADPRRVARATLEMIDDYNSIVENSVRLAAFQAARKQGLSAERAASIAKNITVNFNRKGNLSPAINAWFMFFNASVQGSATLVNAAIKNPKARAVLGGMALTGFLLDTVNREVMGDEYDMIPDFEKSHNAIFSTGDGSYVKVPYPLGLNAIFNIGRLTSEGISGASHKKPIEYGMSMAASVLDSFNPMGSVGGVGELFSPSVARPAVQLADNRSFTGAPVYKSGDRGPRGDAPEPAHRRHFQNTPELWVAASRGMNALTGGDYVEKGAVDVSPDALRHIFTSMTGGIGRAADRTLDYFTSDEPSASRMPFVGRVAGKVDDRMRERAYMGEAKRINTAINEVDFLLKSGRPDAADDIIKKLGKGDLDEGFRILGAYRGAKKELDTLRRREAPTRMQEPDDETTEIGRIMRDMRRQTMERALREGRP